MTDALDAVIDAALERALVDGADSRRYFALAGSLERARNGSDDDGRDCLASAATATRDADRVAPLTAALMSVAAVSALAESDPEGIDPTVWSPGSRTSRSELVAAGAAAAHRRFDVGVDVLVARSGLSRARLDRDGDVQPETRR